MEKRQPHDLTDRNFGLLFAAVFAVVGLAIWLLGEDIALWPFAVGIVFLVAALGAPGVLMPLNRIWRVISRNLMQANTAALTALAYAITIVPSGAVMRLFGGDPMNRRLDKSATTYWSPVSRQATAERFDDQF